MKNTKPTQQRKEVQDLLDEIKQYEKENPADKEIWTIFNNLIKGYDYDVKESYEKGRSDCLKEVIEKIDKIKQPKPDINFYQECWTGGFNCYKFKLKRILKQAIMEGKKK